MGDLAGVSFYPGKNLGAYGEGGAVLTNNDAYARTIRMLRDWGQEKKYQHVLKGFNARMEGIQGAVLRVKLKHLEQWTESRRAHAAHYHRLLADYPKVVLPKAYPDRRHVYHVYAIRVRQRDNFMKFLLDRGIQTGIHYPIAVHLLPAYADLGKKPGDFPAAEKAAAEVVSLPMYPELTDKMIAEVASAVKAWAA
jgi:dTDP-4-amino-4,6-dideoxygalactose transaminase